VLTNQEDLSSEVDGSRDENAPGGCVVILDLIGLGVWGLERKSELHP